MTTIRFCVFTLVLVLISCYSPNPTPLVEEQFELPPIVLLPSEYTRESISISQTEYIPFGLIVLQEDVPVSRAYISFTSDYFLPVDQDTLWSDFYKDIPVVNPSAISNHNGEVRNYLLTHRAMIGDTVVVVATISRFNYYTMKIVCDSLVYNFIINGE